MPKKQEKAAASEKKTASKKAATTKTVKKKESSETKKAPKMSAKAKKQAEAAATALEEANQKWLELKEKFSSEKAVKYSMEKRFETNKPIEHPVLGWGFVMNIINDRLEVLFKDGVRVLISNYSQK
jgi:hypothetical protein